MAVIRSRTDADIDNCVSALHQVQSSEGYPQGVSDLKAFLIDNEKIQKAWVAEHDGAIVGHISTGNVTKDLAVDLWKQVHPENDSFAVLSRLFVLHAYRKDGIAVKLVELAVTEHAKDGIRLVLWVVIANIAAIRLYDRLGWERFGTTTYTREDGTTMPAICFASPLSD